MNIKKFVISLLSFGLFLNAIPAVFAQGMMGQYYYPNYNYNNVSNVDTTSTLKDEADGKAIWDKLQAKQTTCQNLTDDDYDVLGDYFMGQLTGTNHAAMNARMTQMMGAAGEKQMHIIMGKSYSGCDPNVTIPAQYQNFLSFMPMMMGNSTSRYYYQDTPTVDPLNYQNNRWNMMGTWENNGFPFAGIITMVLVWSLLILAIISLFKYLGKSNNKKV